MKRSIALLLSLGLAAFAFAHPHFPKTVEMRLGAGKDAKTIKVEHLTVTFNKEGFAAAKEGDSWHLAGATLETGLDVKIGGKDVKAGKYGLLTRKMKSGDWELILDAKAKPFSREISADALALETKFEKGQPVQEHLRLDLQPSGDKEHVALFLEVHFDQYKATARVDVPTPKSEDK